jgi:phage antirepressor YoqD-like protein
MNDITDARKPTMSSREIALLTGHRHDQVLRTARALAEQGVTQSVETLYVHEQNGQKYPEHQMNKRDSLVLVARLSPEFTATVVDRWQELEQQVAKPALPDFANPVEAARAWADAKESEQRAIEQAEAAKPAVEFVDRFVETGNTKSIRETAKILGLPERAFIKAMIEDKILFRQSGSLLPHQRHHAAERFEVKTGERNGHAYEQTRVTSAGIDYLARVYGYWIGEVAA